MPPAVTSSSPDEDAETHFIHSPELEIRRTETPGKSLEKLLRGICNPNHDNFFSDSDDEEELEDQNYDVLLESASRQSSPQQQLPPQPLSNNTMSSTKSSPEDFFQQLRVEQSKRPRPVDKTTSNVVSIDSINSCIDSDPPPLVTPESVTTTPKFNRVLFPTDGGEKTNEKDVRKEVKFANKDNISEKKSDSENPSSKANDRPGGIGRILRIATGMGFGLCLALYSLDTDTKAMLCHNKSASCSFLSSASSGAS